MVYPSCSVIITTCDRPDQLRRCIASVLRQTFRPLEMIVVDDCSSNPNEHAISEQGPARHVTMRYHRLARRSGACVARNTGARLATGEISHVPGR